MNIILTRHGETVENRKKMLQGHIPGTLSSKGITQANELGRELTNAGIDLIVCSDLKRSVDTSNIVNGYLNIDLVEDRRLREIDWGDLTGLPIDPLTLVYKEEMPDSVETNLSLYSRASDLLQELYKANKDRTILLVGHGAVNRAFIAVLESRDYRDIVSIQIQKNAEIYRGSYKGVDREIDRE